MPRGGKAVNPTACAAVREMRGIPQDTRTRTEQLDDGDLEIDVWEERDRLSIRVDDRKTGCRIAEWWDDDARQMFEDGFFKLGIEHQPLAQTASPALKRSIAEYLDSMRI